MALCFVNAGALLENKGKTVAVLYVTPAGIAKVGDTCESQSLDAFRMYLACISFFVQLQRWW